MAASAALVENAAGLTCLEAFACHLPVITYRPIAGHGRDGARVMEAAGLSLYPRTPDALVAALDQVTAHESAVRQRLVDSADALFARDAASLVFPEPINGAPPINQGHRRRVGSTAPGPVRPPGRS